MHCRSPLPLLCLAILILQKVPRWVARVLGFEHHLAAFSSKALAQRLAVHSGDHNVAGLSLNGAVDYHEVAWVDAGANHAVPFHAHKVDVRGPHIEQLIERNALLKVVGC